MKSLKLIIILACLPLYLCCKKQDISIVPIESLNYINTIKSGDRVFTNKGSYFLIKGYDGSDAAMSVITKFILNNKDADYANYDSYTMVFFKESSQTSIENIKRNPKIIDRYSNEHDHIYEFLWHKGKFIATYKFKDGILIQPGTSDIILSPAPALDSIRIK